MFVEVSRMPGTGALTLTGGLGEGMQESARVALSWVRANAARYGIDPRFHRGADMHVHVQSGALRKDGASAGVAMVSALTGRVVRGDLAMTGESGPADSARRSSTVSLPLGRVFSENTAANGGSRPASRDRHGSDTSLERSHEPAPAVPRRPPASQRDALSNRDRPHALAPL